MSNTFKTMWYEYERNNNVVWLFKKQDGKIIKEEAPFKPYFFIDRGKERIVQYFARKLNLSIALEETDLKSLEQNPLTKVIVDYPKAVALLRDKLSIRSYEADIPFVRRVMIDCDWRIATDYNIAYWDTEVNEKTGKIVAISLVDKNREECFIGDEKQILFDFVSEIQKYDKYDMLVGYNSDLFDIPLLRKALNKHKIPFDFDAVRWYDLMWSLKSARQRMFPSWSLDFVAKEIVGRQRVHTEKKIFESTEQEIKERCITDAALLMEIDENELLTKTDVVKANLSYVFPDEASVVSRCVDSLLLSKARKLGYVLPNKPSKVEEIHHSGALVLQPPEPFKVYENVVVLDYVSLYPNIIINFGISPDKEKKLYTETVKELLKTRVEWKRKYQKTNDQYAKVMQYALKILLNAFYGVLSSPYFRIRRKELGEEVAVRGRQILFTTISSLQKQGYEIIYGDTDSLFVRLDKLTEDEIERLEELVNKTIKEQLGVDINVDAEKVFGKLMFAKKANDKTASKKKYAGYVVWRKGMGKTNDLIIVGFEAVRSDYPNAAREFQKTLIELQLKGVSKEQIKQYIFDFRKALFEGMIEAKDLIISKSITKKDYKVKAEHVVAAEKAKKLGLNEFIGNKIQYLHTKFGVEPYSPNVKNNNIDYKYYWSKVFIPIIERTIGLSMGVDYGKLDEYFD